MEEAERLLQERSLIRFQVSLLESRDWIVRNDAAQILGKIGNASAVPDLIKRLKDTSRGVRISAIEALGRIASERSQPALLMSLKTGSSYEKGAAATAITRSGSPSVLPHLFLALETEDAYVRFCIIEGLGNIKSESTISVLKKALNDPEIEVQRVALWSLFNCEADIDLATINAILAGEKDDHFLKWMILEILCFIKKKAALPVVKQQLKSREPLLGFLAAVVIAKMGDNSTVPILLDALTGKCEYEKLRAIEALGDLGDKSVTPRLIKALEKEDTPAGVYYSTVAGFMRRIVA